MKFITVTSEQGNRVAFNTRYIKSVAERTEDRTCWISTRGVTPTKVQERYEDVLTRLRDASAVVDR